MLKNRVIPCIIIKGELVVQSFYFKRYLPIGNAKTAIEFFVDWDVDEIVLGVEASSEGDVTNLYLSNLLKNLNVKVTRFSRGMPIGSSLEFIDEITLSHSINDRVEVK